MRWVLKVMILTTVNVSESLRIFFVEEIFNEMFIEKCETVHENRVNMLKKKRWADDTWHWYVIKKYTISLNEIALLNNVECCDYIYV